MIFLKDCIRQCIQNSNAFRELNNQKTKVVMNMIKHLIVVSGERETLIECERKVKELLDKFTCISSQQKAIDMKNICPICNCDFDSPYGLQQCGHTFCHSCLTAYFDTYFDATIGFDAFKLSCPLQQCNEVCLIRDIISVLGFERMARLAMIAFQIYIRRVDNNLVQCMGIDCKQVGRVFYRLMLRRNLDPGSFRYIVHRNIRQYIFVINVLKSIVHHAKLNIILV